MKTGFRGTFVISWAQTQLDGLGSPPVSDIGPGRTWVWSGEAVRVDGPRGVLPLGMSEKEAKLRKHAAPKVRRLLVASNVATDRLDAPILRDPLFNQTFTVTDGFKTWEVTVIAGGPGRKPLLMFHAAIPPRNTDLWIVSDTIGADLRSEASKPPGGVICFTPGTMILTPQGPRDVASLAEGNYVQTQDNGPAEVLWVGRRHVTGARMRAMPDLVPVRLREGALDKDVPDEGLLVSPDHRMVLRGARARALFSQDEVLVTAKDLVNDLTVQRDHSLRGVTYIHMMLPQHEIVFANGVATESFHPASAALATMQPLEQERLFDRLPDIRGNPGSYGAYARRVLTDSETAIMRQDSTGRTR